MTVHRSARRGPARVASILVACWLALAVVACESDDTGAGSAIPTPTATPTTAATASPGTPTPNPTVCADAAALRASVDELLAVTVRPGLADEIEADLKDVQAKLATLRTDARGGLQDEVTALESALSTLQTAVQSLAANPDVTAVQAVRTALQQLGPAARDLQTAIEARCPSASPSPTG